MFYKPVWEYEGCLLVQRPDTPNYFIYWTPRGSTRARRKSTGTRDLGEAQRILIEFVHANGRPPKKSADTLPILDALCDYIEGRILTSASYRNAGKVAMKHVTEFLDLAGIAYVAEFDLATQQRYIDWRRAALLQEGFTASNATFNRELGFIKAAFRWAWKRGRLESAPYVQLLPNPPPRDRFLRVHEVRRLLAACEPDHLRLYVMLALHTLQRPRAIYELRIEQVDLTWGRIDFLPPGTLQSNKRRPVVPITPSLRPFLEKALAESRTGNVIEYDGGPVRSVKRAFATACKIAGLDNVTPYILRHTGATLMAATGVPLRQIAGMLGHTETRTTEIYAKHHPDFLQDASRALETLFGTSEQLPSVPTLTYSESPGGCASSAPNGDEHARMESLEAADCLVLDGAVEKG